MAARASKAVEPLWERNGMIDLIRRGQFKKYVRLSELDCVQDAAEKILKSSGPHITAGLFDEAKRLVALCEKGRVMKEAKERECERRFRARY